MAGPLLSVKNLRVAFGRRVVVHDLSFDVSAGDILAILGPNGAGKTVLLKALLNLIPYDGEIRWSPDARLGYVPQRTAADHWLPLTLHDLLSAKAAYLHRPADVAAISSRLGFTPEILDTRIGLLSGGQFQKALIAFALLGNPNVLLFDEPTASLDELTEERIHELLHTLQKEMGMTVILVSHDLSVVYRYAGKVLCLSGEKSCMGPPKEILTPETLEDLYAAPAKFYRHVDSHS
jgi:zinc transport system ATP-binding protein